MLNSFQWTRSAKPTFTQAQSHWAESFTASTAAANEEACLVQLHYLLGSLPRTSGMSPWYFFARYIDHFLASFRVPWIPMKPVVSFHLTWKAGSHPWAFLRIWTRCWVAQSEGRNPSLDSQFPMDAQWGSCKVYAGGCEGDLFRCHLPFVPLKFVVELLSLWGSVGWVRVRVIIKHTM